MVLIIGLGNPGAKYAGTRHNIGFSAVTALADACGIELKTKECRGLTGTGVIEGVKVKLVQPQTFMNLSGECVRALMDFYKVPADDILVICDEISLPTGKLRIRAKGSAGGHNGMKNIIAQIGTSDFARLRIGVGEKPEGWDLADHVLAHFPKEEEEAVRDALKKTVAAVRCFLSDGIAETMNRFNG
ncbi:MAG: aminoacyl-tRNA hydrolase [Lachnospiraceae bacterium]|nr:aminoacyl-tRNA hydrolase [Lachnospiraceae bacterium]